MVDKEYSQEQQMDPVEVEVAEDVFPEVSESGLGENTAWQRRHCRRRGRGTRKKQEMATRIGWGGC